MRPLYSKVSATPSSYEIEHSAVVAEQVIRPTGLLDPEIDVRPSRNKIEDLLEEIDDIAAKLGLNIVVVHIQEEETKDFQVRWRGMKEFVQENIFQTDVSYYTSNHDDYFEGVEHYIGKNPGSLLVMRGRTQRVYVHALPKTRSPVEPRVNLTYRVIRNGVTGSPADTRTVAPCSARSKCMTVMRR